MKSFAKQFFVLVVSCFGVTAIAADIDGSETLLCSFAQITECDLGSECSAVTNESIDAPDFVKFDFKRKKFTAISAGVETAPDDIDNVVDLASYIVVQGAQGGAEGAADTLAWSATINHATGLMVVTASGENAGFVVFGACMPI